MLSGSAEVCFTQFGGQWLVHFFRPIIPVLTNMKVPFKLCNRTKALLFADVIGMEGVAEQLSPSDSQDVIAVNALLPADQISTQVNAVNYQLEEDRLLLKGRIKELDHIIMPIVLRLNPKVRSTPSPELV